MGVEVKHGLECFAKGLEIQHTDTREPLRAFKQVSSLTRSRLGE